MSGTAKAWAEGQWRRRDLSAAAKVVLMVLADHHQLPTAKNPDAGCFPAQETIAADSGMARSTINRHLDALVADGVIARERRNTAEGREATRYTLVGLAEPMSDSPEVVEAKSDKSDVAKPMSAKSAPMSEATSEPTSGATSEQSDTNPSLNPYLPAQDKRSPSELSTRAHARHFPWAGKSCAWCSESGADSLMTDGTETVAVHRGGCAEAWFAATGGNSVVAGGELRIPDSAQIDRAVAGALAHFEAMDDIFSEEAWS